MLVIVHKYLVVLTWRTLCLQMCSRKTVKLIQKLSAREELRAPVQRSRIILRKTGWSLEFIGFRAIEILHNWCGYSLSYTPLEIWICESLSVRINHPATNANELGPAWQNIAGKSEIHGQKENGLELFRSRRHFGESTQPNTLNQPQWSALHFKRGRKSILMSRPLSMK